jgi:CheY-like chemotaxis protein
MVFREMRTGRRGRVDTLRPEWPADAAPGSRIVVECRDHDLSDAAASALEAGGHTVMTCSGPDDVHRCPLLETGSCALVDGAAVVVNLLGLDGDEPNEVLRRLRSTTPDTPVVVEASAAERDRHGDALDGVFVVEPPLRRSRLLAEVTRAQVGLDEPD